MTTNVPAAEPTVSRDSTISAISNSSLLRLPGELRNKIYGYLLSEHIIFVEECSPPTCLKLSPDIDVHTFHNDPNPVFSNSLKRLKRCYERPPKDTKPLSQILGLSQVNRQLRAECSRLTYKTNLFWFSNIYAFQIFCAQLTPTHRDLITEIAASSTLTTDLLSRWTGATFKTAKPRPESGHSLAYTSKPKRSVPGLESLPKLKRIIMPTRVSRSLELWSGSFPDMDETDEDQTIIELVFKDLPINLIRRRRY